MSAEKVLENDHVYFIFFTFGSELVFKLHKVLDLVFKNLSRIFLMDGVLKMQDIVQSLQRRM